MSVRDRMVANLWRHGLRAIVMPTYKGGDEAIRLIIQDGEKEYVNEFRSSVDTVGHLDTKVAERIRELGYELCGHDRFAIPNMWLHREGCYQHLLKRKEG